MSAAEMVYLPAGRWEQLLAQQAEILRMLQAPKAHPEIMPRAQAIAYAGKRSTSAFDRWCTRYGITACGRGRYVRKHLDRAIAEEARGTRA